MHRFTSASLVLLTLVTLAPDSAHAAVVSDVPDAFVNSDLVSTVRVDTGSAGLGFLTYTITNIALLGDYGFTDGSPASSSGTYTANPVLTFYQSATSTTPIGSVVLNGQFVVEANEFYGAFPGTFPLTLISSTASGTIDTPLGPVPVSVRLSTENLGFDVGQSSIVAGPGNNEFTVNTSLTQYSEYSLDGGITYLPLPPIQSTGVQASVPEPSSLALVALGGLTLMRRRRA